jgi:hypothetical protein
MTNINNSLPVNKHFHHVEHRIWGGGVETKKRLPRCVNMKLYPFTSISVEKAIEHEMNQSIRNP